MRCWIALLVVVIAALAPASPSRACGINYLTNIAIAPGGPMLVLQYGIGGSSSAGLLISRDGGKTWGLSCASAVAADARLYGSLVFARRGTPYIGSGVGVLRGDRQACNWVVDAPFSGWLLQLGVDPTDDDVLYALWHSGGATTFARSASPGVWTTVATDSEWIAYGFLIVDAGSGPRIYETASRPNDDGGSDHAIGVSDDGGKSFRYFMLENDLSDANILAVDPRDPARLLIAANLPDESQEIRISDDEGQTFREYLTLTGLHGMVITPEGRVFIAQAGDSSDGRGLWAAANLDTTPVRLEDQTPFSCLGYDSATSTLYGCTRFAFGRVDPSTGELTQLLDFTELDAVAACPGDLAATCEQDLCLATCPYCDSSFPRAPLCQALRAQPDSACGPPRPEDDPAAAIADASTLSSSALASATAGQQSGDASVANRVDGGETRTSPGGKHKADPTADGASSGCNAVASAAREQSAAGAVLWLLTALGLLARRRRRRAGW